MGRGNAIIKSSCVDYDYIYLDYEVIGINSLDYDFFISDLKTELKNKHNLNLLTGYY